MQIVRFDRASLVPVPWKNGGGLTREVIRRPADALLDAIDWRVSIAQVEAEGPFSIFPGIERVIVLLDGAGMHLRSPGGEIDRRLDTALVPFTFDGEAAVTGTLISGASSDFNVMTRRDTMQADVTVVRTALDLPSSAHGVLFAARGSWTARSVETRVQPSREQVHALTPGTGLWWDASSLTWRLSPDAADAALIAVRLVPRTFVTA